MLLEEFDVDEYERTIKAEGREEGLKIGEERGREQGQKIGTERAFTLARKLMEQNRTEDLKRLADDPEYREQLFREFKL